MTAIIKEQKKHQSQPTNSNTIWVLSYLPSEAKVTDSIMGWIGSGDTKQQLKLEFDTLKQAEAYAKSKKITYRVQHLEEGQMRSNVVKSYLNIYRK